MQVTQLNPVTGTWDTPTPEPYTWGLIPIIKHVIKHGHRDGMKWIGIRDGIKPALFADWGIDYL